MLLSLFAIAPANSAHNATATQLSALNSISANVMIVDKDFQITYINESLRKCLKEIETEIRSTVPGFSADSAAGLNLSQLHQEQGADTKLTVSVAKGHKSRLNVAGTFFDLISTPLFDNRQQAAGYAIEWLRPEITDCQGQVTAINKAQAVIEFDLNGNIITANKNFCGAMGYDISEIRGKHHSLFIEESYRNSREYSEFWDDLRRGNFKSAKYKRLGKGGKEIWIEASYNPILDENGKALKVVKYASDITDLIHLIEGGKKTIDQNLSLIEAAVEVAGHQASAGASASEQTSHNVQAVASGAEELSASVREIAESMSKSRDAAEIAYQNTEAADQATQALANAAKAMSNVVDMIQNIAGQINLLALNATIESARAGEAGKGFAVVASEVKNLSRQATEATHEISKEIQNMQNVSNDVVMALSSIRSSIESVREFVTNTASAVEEQSAVAREMSSNMQQAAVAVNTISNNIAEIASAVHGVDDATQKTKEAAKMLTRN